MVGRCLATRGLAVSVLCVCFVQFGQLHVGLLLCGFAVAAKQLSADLAQHGVAGTGSMGVGRVLMSAG
jgi:hypothetical protein